MTKEIIIIALVILVIYLYYQQKKKKKQIECKGTQTDDNWRDKVINKTIGPNIIGLAKSAIGRQGSDDSKNRMNKMVEKELKKLREQYPSKTNLKSSEKEDKSDDPRVNFMHNLEKKSKK